MEQTLSARFQTLASRTTMFRGDAGYGRKPDRGLLAELSKSGPVDVHHYVPADNKIVIERFQEVDPILAANRAELLSGHDGYTPSRDLRKVASIPLIIVEQLYQRGINIFDPNDWPKVAGLLDSPEWQAFRTAPGRISRRAVRETFVPARKR